MSPRSVSVWQHVKFSDVNHGTRHRDGLVADEDVKKPSKRTHQFHSLNLFVPRFMLESIHTYPYRQDIPPKVCQALFLSSIIEVSTGQYESNSKQSLYRSLAAEITFGIAYHTLTIKCIHCAPVGHLLIVMRHVVQHQKFLF